MKLSFIFFSGYAAKIHLKIIIAYSMLLNYLDK